MLQFKPKKGRGFTFDQCHGATLPSFAPILILNSRLPPLGASDSLPRLLGPGRPLPLRCSQQELQPRPLPNQVTHLQPCIFTALSTADESFKTFERIVKKYLQNHLEYHMKISHAQHGFRQKRSCLSQLLEHYEYILKGLEQGLNVDTVYLDFSKAFDKVDKGILGKRMKEKGICGKLGIWLHNFLSGRVQHVITNNVKSFATEVTSGVPQGTVLGPLLFLLLIDSISDINISGVIRLFADDTRATKVIKTEEDMEAFQGDLEELYKWQSENNMIFNGTKFEILRYGNNEDLKNTCNYLTPNAEEIIERKELLKDLGIKMNDKADFTDHVNFVITKVKQRAGWILRSFRRRNPDFMKHMWKTYMQGHIDYCSQLWQPLQSGMLQRIENLQKSFTKKNFTHITFKLLRKIIIPQNKLTTKTP